MFDLCTFQNVGQEWKNKSLLNSLVKPPAVPPVNAWFMAGGKIIGLGRDRGPRRFMNFGRGQGGPGVAIMAGAPVEHWPTYIKSKFIVPAARLKI